ncbi:hypothetical protein GA0115240_109430 [Streptomyces sp. DvalAA-14]|uniref:hypothetical protein n=1 Tax=unclassified Streptomyces TaxID=2593676 RepID=UPI00081AEC03|nr:MULTISPECIES: hypothetical protein [unclassified Streptomyces]MYS19521.1 hypothetical protein [Streptomyces sp. SID4948]SCD46295.1 hypothetical protein GA0115240_109430 [Streptomyces sp. DvalAA-14]
MGFSGDFVLARSDRPLLELPPLGAASCGECADGCLHPCAERTGGWRTAQSGHGFLTDHPKGLLRELVASTGAPALLARVMDSDMCQVWGLTPSGAQWTVLLDPVMAADYDIPVPGPDEVRATAGSIAGWAAEAGFAAEPGALLSVLTKRADPFVEDLFFELIDACGLPPADPAPAAGDGPDTPAHPGHRADARCPRGAELEAAVLDLARDRHLVLECAGDDQCYAQVWLRPDGTYQLEYRDRDPTEHYWTRTSSAQRVIEALTGWVAGDLAWRESFQWSSLASWFTEPTA